MYSIFTPSVLYPIAIYCRFIYLVYLCTSNQHTWLGTHYILFSKCLHSTRVITIGLIHHATTSSKEMNHWWRQPSSWLYSLQPLLRGHFFWVRVITLWSLRWDTCGYLQPGNELYLSCFSWMYTCIAGSLYLTLPWSNFISYSSLFPPVWYPYQISRMCWRQIPSPVTSAKIYFLFSSLLLHSFNHNLPVWKMRFFELLWNQGHSSLASYSSGALQANTHWKVELICMLEVPDMAHHLSLLVKPLRSLPLIQPLHYSLDNMGCRLSGKTDTLSINYWMYWSQIVTHYL